MKTTKAIPNPPAAPGGSLERALGQRERVHDLVKESAEELSSINTALKEETAGHKVPPALAEALEKNEAVERKVGEASGKLMAMNDALEGAVRDRVILEHQFAAATEQEEAARHAAFHDPLTGLANRMLFSDRLEHGIAQATRHQWTLAVMYLDLDEFKAINDTHGHDVGDEVLKTVALRLTESTRDEDTVGRVGGDEFVYLLMEMPDEATIAMMAQKIALAIQAPIVVHARDLRFDLRVNPSIGISVFPKDGATAAALVSRADLAMYQAKRERSGHSFVRDGL